MKKKAKRPATKKSQSTAEEREVIYPKPKVSIHLGDKALTATQAKQLLDWEEESDEPFGEDYLLKDDKGKKIRCHNNIRNRPFSTGNIHILTQEILRGRWQFNMENRIISKTGLVLNGQHTLISLILANQAYERDPDKYDLWNYLENHKMRKSEGITIETTIAYGASEDPHVVDTLDTCKPRSLSDVLFRGPFFADLATKDRKAVCRIADYAVKFVWSRTGVSNAYKIRRTHSESIDFLERHPRLVEAVQFIHDENASERKISRFVAPGIAAGLLYLMGSATTEPRLYHQADNPREDLLDWELWDKASDFWALLAGDSEEFQPLRNFLGKVIDDGDSTAAAKTAVLVHGWSAFLSEKMGGVGNRKLKYETSEDGVRILAECPTVGGIDLGDGEWENEPTPQDPTPEEIAARSDTERKKRTTKKKAKKTTKKKKSVKKKTRSLPFRFGQTGWLAKEDGESRKVKIIKLTGKIAIVRTEAGFLGSGMTEKIDVGQLSHTQPGHKQPHEVPDEKEE